MMIPEIAELRARLMREFDTIRDGVPAKFHGSAILELVRTMDLVQLDTMIGGEWPEPWITRGRYGTVRALSLFLPGAATAKRLPDLDTATEHAEWAGNVLFHCGRLSLVALFVDYAASGLVSLRKKSPNHYHIRTILPHSGVEALEREDLDWGQEQIAISQRQEEEELEQQEPEILNRFVCAMSLDAGNDNDFAEVLSDYCEAKAVLRAERMLGYDYFPNDAKLGGIDFLSYKLAVVVILRMAFYECYHIFGWSGLTLRPLESLAARKRLAAILPREEIVSQLMAGLQVDHAKASQIMEMLTLDAEFASTNYSTIPSAANPPFIAVSRDHITRSLHGCLNAPFQFLLARLRKAFPEDWRSAANRNEAVFRQQLYDLFSGERFLCIPREVVLRDNGRAVTDIDAFVLDRETGVAGLFQLKWWFAFGASMRERSSMAKNMEESSQWIERVQRWLAENGVSALAHQANLRRSDGARLRRVRLFLLGRNFVHFSGAQPRDSDGVARGNWQQVLRLVAEELAQECSVDALWEALRRDSPHLRTRTERKREVVDAGAFRVTFEM